nr:cyclochlorotine synthetase [Quercus suber]
MQEGCRGIGAGVAFEASREIPRGPETLLYSSHVQDNTRPSRHVDTIATFRYLSQHSSDEQFYASDEEDGDFTLDLTSEWDVQQATEWNGEPAEQIHSCVHELFETQAKCRAKASAIRAWDGDFTYEQLNAAANRLAHLLADEYKVRTGDLVHVCFEKSAWFFVAMLAINKAGAAWVPLDPSHPTQRLQQVAQQTGARIALTSTDQSAKCAEVVTQVLEVTAELDRKLVMEKRSDLSGPACEVGPNDVAYVLFTSGSTGTPKGLVMEHSAVCTSQRAIGERLGLTPGVRMLQFAAFVFDLSIGEIIGPLIAGACICVPSEHTRMNGLKEFINEKQINWAFLTPAFARTLSPDDVPSLELLLLAGEAVGQDVFDRWFGRVRLINGWGPAETCVFSTLHEWQSADESPLTVGRPVGGWCWIVDTEDPQRLAPTGCLGEVVIQGPTLLREYLADPERTSASTVSALPEWAPRHNSVPWNRFFRSGDLCSYNPDGTIKFSSRKDTQVKIRGLRVELGEVEHHVRSAMDGVRQVVVDVFTTDIGSSLAAYFTFSDETRAIGSGVGDDRALAANVFDPLTTELKRQIASVVGELNVALPSYMVPTLFVPCRYMPSIASTKLDRAGLRRLAKTLDREQAAHYSLQDNDKNEPVTDIERRLQQVWTHVLHLPAEAIGRDDSFLQLGGDSISAMQMVTEAREAGMELTVKDIFDDPRLLKVAAKAIEVEVDSALHEVEPFSLLPHGETEAIKFQLRKELALANGQSIEDAYPCTGAQEGLMALSVKQPGSYMAKYVYQIPEGVDLARFSVAWEETVKICSTLRARIAAIGGTTVQALITADFAWEETEGVSLRTFMSTISRLKMGYASRLSRYGIVEGQTERYFVLVLHHAIFDGWSLGLIFNTFQRAYDGAGAPASQSYANFIKYTMSVDRQSSINYWTEQLRDAKRATFPPPSSSVQSDNLNRIMKTTIPFPRTMDSSITKATVLRAAWAVVLAQYCDSDDVCFASTVSGRHAPVYGVERMVGPSVATIPVRIRLDRQQTVSALLQQVQAQATEMVAYEQFGLRNISKISPEAKEACDASSLMIIQPTGSTRSTNIADQGILAAPSAGIYGAEEAMEGYFSYPLVIQGMTFEERVELNLIYHANVVSEARLQALSRHFAHVVQQLLQQDERPLAALSLSGEWDLQQATAWNRTEAAPVRSCMHDLVAEQAVRHPEREAIVSSERSLHYAELERMSTQLAIHLEQLGVGPESMVPICFEKSAWAIIAMLGVMKAGGAFVPIDPSHPVARRQALVGEVDARVMLVSPTVAKTCQSMVENVIELSDTLMAQLPSLVDEEDNQRHQISPTSAAYVIFTSGSTGKPKTIVVDHSALCTSSIALGQAYSLSEASRVLQFSTFVFDVSLGEIFTTLVSGGTVCVPTEMERLQSTVDFIATAKVNTAMLTPSFVNTFTPDEVPTLTTLVLGGEAPTKANMEAWYGRVKLINGYGPAEAVIYCATYEFQSADESPTTIGRGTYGSCWVVDPNDHQRLAPIGCTGELLIRGHALARGYAGDEAATARSFIENVSWLPQSTTGDQPRFYKTGDLVRYRADGMLEYLGRKDTQVKIRGQRVELGAIEASIQQALPDSEHVAVDVVRREAGEALVAFVSFTGETNVDKEDAAEELGDELLSMDEDMRTMLIALVDNLKATLPPYMVPSLFLPLRRMPLGTSMKLDRRRLRDLAGGLAQEQLTSFALATRTWVAPTTSMELRLRDVWAHVLKIAAAEIGKNDDFLQIGGDSISAIQVVTAAREAGMVVTVKDIFDDPRLYAVAAQAEEVENDDETHEVEPFSLLPQDEVETIKLQLREQCGLSDRQMIEDAYPCTSLQEGLMALAVKQPGSYMAKHVYRVPAHVDVARFMAAWERTVSICGNLRTRIVTVGKTTVQALVTNDSAWEPTAGVSLKTFMSTTSKLRMGYGSRLCRFGIIEESSVERYFVMIIHHAIFDGWSLELNMNTLQQTYQVASVPATQPYAGFIKYLMEVDAQEASNYWTEQLRDAKRATFPAKSRTNGAVMTSCGIRTTLSFPKITDSSITKATMLRAAWAVVLARYCDTTDVCFGTTVSGRHASVFGIEKMAGPAVATVPVRMRFDEKQTVTEVLRAVQTQASEMVAYEQFGLQRISRLGSEIKEACDFSSLLVIQPNARVESNDDAVLGASQSKEYSAEEGLSGYFSYPVVLQCFIQDDQVDLYITYDSAVLHENRLNALSMHFDHVLKQLMAQDERPLHGISLAGEWDLERAVEWNGAPPEPVSSCVHRLVETQAKQRADAPAIQAWDGDFTYGQLNAAANRLAHLLVDDFAVRVGDLVHVCFEKSAWFFVAMLAINKAGAAWVPLDPSHPSQRLQQVVQQTGAKVVLTSADQSAKCADLVAQAVEVTAELDQQLVAQGRSDVSGPTLCTSQRAIGERLGLTSEVRMLQFAAFVFDLSIGEIVGPLIAGACICVPSEHTRMNGLKEFMVEKAINWAFLTPAFARTMSPDDVPDLELLLLAGEAVGQDVFDHWFGRVRLINGWGPAETCVFSTLHEWQSADESPLTVGRPVGGWCWIVDPEEPQRLAPIGCLGEVVIQGPTLLREYLADPERTAASMTSALPEWAPRRETASWSRFFRSGDLCSYNPDGTIEFSSRKDTQVKIRGLRVELGEVEHHTRAALDRVRQVVVDVFKTEAGSTLAAFFAFNDETRTVSPEAKADGANVFLPITPELKRQITAAAGELSVALPSYMVPTLFVPCQYIPSITSTKLDRNGLKRLAATLDQQQVAHYALQDGEKNAPVTELEKRLQKVWAGILHLPVEAIGRDDSFLRIGGDSITAIQMVTAAREAGMALTVKDVFDDPRLFRVAAQVTEIDGNGKSHVIDPFSLLPWGEADAFKSQIRHQCLLSDDQTIEDAYPCTSLQEGLMALAIKQPGSYMARYVYQVPLHVDLARFQVAWERTVEACGNLRTRILSVKATAVQALILNDIAWEPTSGISLRSFMRSASNFRMGYGSRLCRYGLLEQPSGERYFALVIHHAVFDGWSLNLLMSTLQQIYHSGSIPTLQPFTGFIEYTMNIDGQKTGEYWKEQLCHAKRATFPPRDAQVQSENSTSIMRTTIPFPKTTKSSITKATILRAAWALVLARYCDSDDVCFASTISGRHAPVAGIDRMIGPSVATVPIRIRLNRQQTVSGLLQQVQAQATEMVAHEQFGLRKISQLGPDAKEACDVTSLMVIQPIDSMGFSRTDDDAILTAPSNDTYGAEDVVAGYYTYPLVIQGLTFDEHVELNLTYHENVLSKSRLQALSHHFAHVVQQLLAQDDRPLGKLSIAGEWDLHQAIQWNGEQVAPVDACVHDLIVQQAMRRPESQAVMWSEGSLTYAELEHMSTQVAYYLSQLGVGPEMLVPICFEKGVWAIVAMLGVMKAGGAFVPIDPSHHFTRRQALINEVHGRVMLVSSSTADICRGMVEHTVELSKALIERLSSSDVATKGEWRPSSAANAAFVIFTSGTTGKPKTIVIEHLALCSSLDVQGKLFGLDERTRTLQFSSYVFDVSITEILGTLMFGGTVCVPTETERLTNIPGFIRSTGVNAAMLTSSFLNTFTPSEVPSLKLLVFSGEAPSKANVEAWHSHVKLINGYGPTETCIYSTTYEYEAHDELPTTIGRGTYGSCWVVEPDDHERLAPIGCTGELLIQGHGLARGYAGNEAATAKSFIEKVSWLSSTATSQQPRLYKTGDLVKYRPDGILEYLGRKDTQVKIRGQRVELGAIEASIQQVLPSTEHVAVDVVRWEAREALVAFISFSVKTSGEQNDAVDDLTQDLLPMDDDMRKSFVALGADLKTLLPPYMVPSLFLPMRRMPFGTSLKLDRKRLRELAAGLEQERLGAFTLATRTWVAPTTPMELRLRNVWADVLKIAAAEIGKNDDFLQIGGDSISAIQVVTAAREAGMIVAIKDIFDDPRLCKLAVRAEESDDTRLTEEIKPFSLLPQTELQSLKRQIREQSTLSDGQKVEDAYPCTSLQEGLMALAVKQPGSYVAKHVYRIPVYIEMARFMAAWERTVRHCGNLRTRIVTVGDTALQALITDDITWESTAGMSLRTFVSTTSKLTMGYGSRLCRFGIVEELDGERYFVTIMHHAIFDGWSLGLALSMFQGAYDGDSVADMQSFAGFIHYNIKTDHQAASNYWAAQLRDAKRATFPPATSPVQSDTVSRIMKTTIPFSRKTDSSITKATILRTAWALVLARYCDSDDVCFASTVSGRHTPVPGIDMMMGPTIATVPVRIKLDRQQTVSAMLRQVQAQATEMVAYEQFGLRNISKISPEAKEACDASSLMIIQPTGSSRSTNVADEGILAAPSAGTYGAEEAMEGYFSYPLVIQGITFDDHVELDLSYHANVLSEARLQALSSHFAHVVQQLLVQDDRLLGGLSVAGQWDLQQAMDWNGADAAPLQACVHDLIAQQAADDPEHEAVVSSEGCLSYAQLNLLSTQLAIHLTQVGVGSGMLVPICFEKSMWAIVAMLGVMKAGAAFVPVDPSHPLGRREALVRAVDAKVMLVTQSTDSLCQNLVEQTVVLSGKLVAEMAAYADEALQYQSCPMDAAYVIFTSGTTGKPKTIIIEHSALSISLKAQAMAFGIGRKTRMLQFSNYVFDMSLAEIFTTLASGGCVCVPTEADRLQNIPDFITHTRVNTALLTPSFASTFQPCTVPTLETLVLGGEAPTNSNLETWHGKVKLINGYGPTETCIYSTSYEYQAGDELPTTIGRGTYGSCWVVDPDDHQRLAPIGCTGELLIRGHALARGYAGDEAATARSFIENVSWLPQSTTIDQPRFYKTGDLVRYRADGMLEYLGRKDTQVKIRGQRVELGAIEASIQQVLPDSEHVAVDVVRREAGEALVAFISFEDKAAVEKKDAAEDLVDEMLSVDGDMRSTFITLADDLKAMLPPYMVPGLFLPMRRMPFGTSMKLDRKRLRDLAGSLAQEHLATFALASRTWVAPTTPMELRLRDVWSQVLKVSAEDIGKNDDFLQIGGDSISAIHIVTAAREAGLSLKVKDIFDDPRLSKVSLQVLEIDEDETHDVEPFSLLPSTNIDGIKTQLRKKSQLSDEQAVEDAYPCTSLQEGLMALAVKQPGSYMAKHVYQVPVHVDTARFKAAWERTVAICGTLRTRIIAVKGIALQALIADDVEWEATAGMSLRSFMTSTSRFKMDYGSRLCRYAIVEESEEERYFVLILHHTVFDGWSLGLLLTLFQHAYDGAAITPFQAYAGFIKYATNVDPEAAGEYWTEQLRGSTKATFPPPSSPVQSENVSRTMETTIPFPRMIDSSITKATILRAAWAVVLARYCDSDDVCFGATVSGRHAPVFGVERMMGPTLATVPVRIRLDGKQKVSVMLRQVQAQATEMVAYEQFGLRNIARLGAEAKEACNISSLMVIQPFQSVNFGRTAEGGILAPPDTDKFSVDKTLEGYFNYPLVIQGITFDDHVNLTLNYHANVVPEARLRALSHHFAQVVEQLLVQDDRLLSELSLAGEWDLQQAKDWNTADAQPMQVCVHDLIAQQAADAPEHEAVVSCEGSLSYAALDRLSTQLAIHLQQLGVGSETFVPICLEKSVWAIVAMLGVMKSGAAFVPVDPAHPLSRRQALAKEVNAQFMLVSPSTADACQGMVAQTVELSDSLMAQLAASTLPDLHIRARPSDVVYVIFTSGTTGKPKTIVIEHSALATSVKGLSIAFEVSRQSRFLQFSSYVFDMSIAEIFTALAFGGTVCVPTEAERLQDIPGFITRTQVNTALLTPSFANTFKPSDVPTLKMLAIGGEAPTKSNLETWHGRVKLINIYGPTETTMICTAYEYPSADGSPTTFGKATYGSLWIVEPEDHHRLAPIGCTGELLIRGYALARGYAGNEVATARSFLESVRWSPPPASGAAPRFYKTGDLVRYNTDGTLEYVGRKDTQIKLRGQRVELGAIEASIKQSLPSVEHVAVDVVRREAGEALVAFMSFGDEASVEKKDAAEDLVDELLSTDGDTRSTLITLADELKAALPPYMVPSLFLPMRRMPFGTSMKLDRKRLRDLAGSLAQEHLATFALASRTWVAPTTPMELRLRDVWSQVLKVSAEDIGKNDDFLQIGGDSISAIQVVTAARDTGLALTIKDIFNDPRLSSVAALVVEIVGDDETRGIEPFSLLPRNEVSAIKTQISRQCNLPNVEDIEDAYPCTSLQQGYMALSVKQTGSYMVQLITKLSKEVDATRLKLAWARTVEICQNLRTRIVLVDGTPVQAVIRDDSAWEPTIEGDIRTATRASYKATMSYGTKLSRYALVKDQTGTFFFVLTLHHAVYDATSLQIIMNTFSNLYQGNAPPTLRSFGSFIKYTTQVDHQAASAFWNAQLHDAQPTDFPPRRASTDLVPGSSNKSGIWQKTIALSMPSGSSITKATLLRAAWAIVLARNCEIDDVCFGTTISGRSAPVKDLENIVGPTIATVPVRIRLDNQQTVPRFLMDVQKQAFETTRFEQFGLHNISKLGHDAKNACAFANLLVINAVHNSTSIDTSSESADASTKTDSFVDSLNDEAAHNYLSRLVSADAESFGAGHAMRGYWNYRLVNNCNIRADSVELHIVYNKSVVTKKQLFLISYQFEAVVQQLLTPDEDLLVSEVL